MRLASSRLDIFEDRLTPSNVFRVLTCWLTTGTAPHSPRYDIMPVDWFQRMGEGVLYGLAKEQQPHGVKDFAEVQMSQGNSFIHNEERIRWISNHVRHPWFVELGDPGNEDAHLLWSFARASDAVLFKLTWHT